MLHSTYPCLNRAVLWVLLSCAWAATPVAHAFYATERFEKVDGRHLPEVAVEGDLALFRSAIQAQLESCGRSQPRNVSSQWKIGAKTIGPETYCKRTLTIAKTLAAAAMTGPAMREAAER